MTRKYTRKNVQSKSSPVKEVSSIIPHVDIETGEITAIREDGVRFAFNDLPLSIRTGVERIIAYRKKLGLLDDSKERKAKAIRYFRGDKPR